MFDRFNVLGSFSGGENTLAAASDLEDNEAAKITNLVPSGDGRTLPVRGGLTTPATLSDISDSRSNSITGMYRYNRADSALGQRDFDIIACGSRVYYYDVSTALWTLLHTFPTTTDTIRFSVLLDKLFITNGVDRMVAWDGFPDNPPVQVSDTGGAWEYPLFPYIIAHRGRLWLAGQGSTVMYCGTEDGGTYPRWRSWAGYEPSDGGSLVVGADDGQRVTGLASLNDDLIVFKSRNIYAWSYGDDSIPKTEGVVAPLIKGLGCASHDTIRYHAGRIIFLGQSDDGDMGVYAITGSGVEELSARIPAAFRRTVENPNALPKAFIHDNTYYIAMNAATGGRRSLVYAYDLSRHLWYEIAGWGVGAFGRSDDGKRLRVGSTTTDSVAEYPLGTSDDGVPIAWEVHSRVVDGGNPFMDKRWRDVAAEVVSDTEHQTVVLGVSHDGGADRRTALEIVNPPVHLYNSGVRYNDASVIRYPVRSLARVVTQELPSRARTIQLRLTGASDKPLAVMRLMARVRSRKVRYE